MEYSKGLVYSVILHLVLIGLLALKSFSHSERYVAAKPEKPLDIVKGVSIDQSQVEEEISRIRTEKRQRQKEAKRLQRMADNARIERLREQRRLKAINDKAKKLALLRKRKQAAEAKRLASLKAEQLKVQKNFQKKKQALDKLTKTLAVRSARELQEKLLREAELKKELARINKAKARAKARADAKAKAKARAKARAREKALLAGKVDKFKSLILNSIAQNWIVPPNVDKGLSCTFEIHLAASGEVLGVKLTRSSGSVVLDRSAMTAIYKASPLPVPKTPDVFALFKVVSLTVRPEAVLN